jgi:hypothetical protein
MLPENTQGRTDLAHHDHHAKLKNAAGCITF